MLTRTKRRHPPRYHAADVGRWAASPERLGDRDAARRWAGATGRRSSPRPNSVGVGMNSGGGALALHLRRAN